MTDSMIERVARAIENAPYCFVRLNKLNDEGENFEVCRTDESGDPIVFARVPTQRRAEQIEQAYNREQRARAAIGAMREPTEAMDRAGWDTRCESPSSAWRDMIDEALK